MIRNRTRSLVLALSLFAAVGAMLPGSHAASAAPIPTTGSTGDVQGFEVEPVKPRPPLEMTVMNVGTSGIGHSGRRTFYHFQVRADAGTLHNVQVRLSSQYRNISDDAANGFSADEVVQLGTYSAPNYRPVIVDCNPPAGKYCTAAYVEATTSTGLHTWGANDIDGYKS